MKEAERKVTELEKTLAITKGELDCFVGERATIENALETTVVECREALDSLKESKHIIDELNAYLSEKHLSNNDKEETIIQDNHEMNEITKLKMAVKELNLELESTQSNLQKEKDLRILYEQKEAEEREKRNALSEQVATMTNTNEQTHLLEKKLKEAKKYLEEQGQIYARKEFDLKAEIRRLRTSLRKEEDEAAVRRNSYTYTQQMF